MPITRKWKLYFNMRKWAKANMINYQDIAAPYVPASGGTPSTLVRLVGDGAALTGLSIGVVEI